MNIREFMSQNHKDCDLLFSNAENAVSKGEWELATQEYSKFIHSMKKHLGVEEKDLFPAFEAATGIVSGPTEMMRMEHDQMRELFSEMQDALAEKNNDDYLGVAETLLILMQQHNMKEEQILYTMMDQHLSENTDQLQKKFQDWDNANA